MGAPSHRLGSATEAEGLVLLPEHLWESLPLGLAGRTHACVCASMCEPRECGRGACLVHECPGLCVPQQSTPRGHLLPVEVGGAVHGELDFPLEAAVWDVLAPVSLRSSWSG